MMDVYRSSVQTWECDQMGHLNVQFYVEKSVEGLEALAQAIGLGPAYARQHDTGFVPVDHHLRFHRELRPGTPMTMRAGVLDVREHSLRVVQELFNMADNTLAATMILDAGFVSRATLKPHVIPVAAREAAESVKVELPDEASPRGITMVVPRQNPTLADAEELGMLTTFQGSVKRHECDAYGRLQVRQYMGRVSDAIPTLLAQSREPGIAGDVRGSNIGGAALEYRMVHRKAAEDGDVLCLKTGLRHVGNKTYSWCHWLFDVDSGDAVMTAEAVAISFDLAARKAIDIPPDRRARLEALVIAGLSV